MKQKDDDKTVELEFPWYGRPRIYRDNAEKQRAYRQRLKRAAIELEKQRRSKRLS